MKKRIMVSSIFLMLFVICMAGALFFFQKDAPENMETENEQTITEVDSNDINAALFEEGTYIISFLYESKDGKVYHRTMNCTVEETPVIREEPKPKDAAEDSAASVGENIISDAVKTSDSNKIRLLVILCVIALLTAFGMIKYFMRRKENGRL